MYVYCVRELGLDIEKVNVNGGAIALGHPLDMLFFSTATSATDSWCFFRYAAPVLARLRPVSMNSHVGMAR